MLSFLRVFKDRATDAEFNRAWVKNGQTYHASTFAFIEGLIVLAALQAAFVVNQSWTIGILYMVAFAAQLILTSIYIRAGTLMIMGRFSLAQRTKDIMLWLTGIAGLAMNVWLVSALGAVVDELMQNLPS